jgi:hypothetical protein
MKMGNNIVIWLLFLPWTDSFVVPPENEPGKSMAV